jgi:hypothetical protein
LPAHHNLNNQQLTVAGCLGYDVLDAMIAQVSQVLKVSVAGCLGYDVLDYFCKTTSN